MSDLYDPKYTRGGYGKYNKHKNFVSMEAGTDAYFLEDEANEMQWIQNELRADLVRKEYYSGIYKKQDNDIIISSKIFDNNEQIFNSFLTKPMVVNVNGYFIDVLGNNGFNNHKNELNYIQLPDAPETGNYYDFVYLEMCFVEVHGGSDASTSTTLWYNGNENNSYGLVENNIFDKRINGETNRRIQLKWNIRSARIPMDSQTLFDESITAVNVPAFGGYTRKSTYGFWNAPLKLDDKTISDDIGLWIAGDGIHENDNKGLKTTDGYSYAIPLFKVIRRNTTNYSYNNIYGGNSVDSDSDSHSTRPDGKFSNIIYEDDIIDLRNIIRCDNMSKLLHNSFENLLLNNVNYETKPYSTIFGVDAIQPDPDTVVYESCNLNSNVNTNLTNDSYEFIPGVEQEGIILKDNNYLHYEKNIYNINLSGITTQLFIKVPFNTNCDITSIYNGENERIKCYINNGILILDIDGNKAEYKFKEHFDKFTHIAIAVKDNLAELIVNNKIVSKIVLEDFRLEEDIVLNIGYSSQLHYANDCIFDEIELSKVFEDSFGRIPASVTSGNAEFSVDTQLNRKSYTKVMDDDTYTFHITTQSDNQGVCEFDLELPITVEFKNIEPKIYFDNESVDASKQTQVTWSLENNVYHCKITGLGEEEITYNFVILAYVNYPAFQGLSTLPRNAYRAIAEKADKPFYSVDESLPYQEHILDTVLAGKPVNAIDKYISYNPFIEKVGFCVALKYNYNIDSNEITLPMSLYTNLVSIYAVMYNGKNIMSDLTVDNNIHITLNEHVTGTVEIYAVTDLFGCVYSKTKCGIESLYQLEDIRDYGDGRRTTFTYRSENKILAMIQGKFGDSQYNYAFVNGKATRVSITIDGAFIHYTFDEPPANKANILAYVVSEYDLLRSERVEFIYDTIIPKYNSEDISQLNGNDIIYHENEIFVTTDGYGIYPYEKDTIHIGGKEIQINKSAIPSDVDPEPEPPTPGPDKEDSIPDEERMIDGDTIVVPEEVYTDSKGRTVYTERRTAIDFKNADGEYITDSVPDTLGGNARIKVEDMESGKEYKYLRVETENGDDIIIHSNDTMFSLGSTDKYGNPMYIITAGDKVHALAVDDEDEYKLYIMNKNVCTLDYLPTVDKLEFKLSPRDILKSNKCDIIYDSSATAHIIARNDLPISTNMCAAINYSVPNVNGSFLTTYNKIYTTNAVEVEKGFKNCSIDNKSFYSLIKLDEDVKHINVFPFIINDGTLKMCILTTYTEDNRIYIDANHSAMDVFELNNKYLLRHM